VADGEFENVTAVAKANIYFEGRVVSHTLRMANGDKKTLGIIYPGQYRFATQAGERVEITSGSCKVTLPGEGEGSVYGVGSQFEVPPNSAFDISVNLGITQYVCSFLS
jgi:uncharacterized protein YaiE (UPF0345 family)